MLSFIDEFGDEYNIIHQPKYSYADMITKPVSENGIAYALKELGLI